MRLYLSNKMTGIPHFNAPWFDKAEAALLKLPGVSEVFNPAEHDRKRGLDPMLCPTGSPDEARAAGGPPLNEVLRADWDWIADFADAVIVGPQWADSRGAISEVACIQALLRPAWEYGLFLNHYGEPGNLEVLKLPPILEVNAARRSIGKLLASPWCSWESN